MRKIVSEIIDKINKFPKSPSDPVVLAIQIALETDGSTIDNRLEGKLTDALRKHYDRTGMNAACTPAAFVKSLALLSEDERAGFFRMYNAGGFAITKAILQEALAVSPYASSVTTGEFKIFDMGFYPGVYMSIATAGFDPKKPESFLIDLPKYAVSFAQAYWAGPNGAESEFRAAVQSDDPLVWQAYAERIGYRPDRFDELGQFVLEGIFALGSDAVVGEFIRRHPLKEFVMRNNVAAVVGGTIASNNIGRYRRLMTDLTGRFRSAQAIGQLLETEDEFFKEAYAFQPFDDRDYIAQFQEEDEMGTNFRILVGLPGFDVNRFTGKVNVLTLALRNGSLTDVEGCIAHGGNLLLSQPFTGRNGTLLFDDYVFAHAFANQNDDSDIHEYVMNHIDPQVMKNNIASVFHALKNDDASLIEQMWRRERIDQDHYRVHGRVLLDYAIMNDDSRGFRFLIENIFGFDACVVAGNKPIFQYAVEKHANCIFDWLLEHPKAAFGLKNGGFTSVNAWAWDADEHVVKRMIEAGYIRLDTTRFPLVPMTYLISKKKHPEVHALFKGLEPPGYRFRIWLTRIAAIALLGGIIGIVWWWLDRQCDDFECVIRAIFAIWVR